MLRNFSRGVVTPFMPYFAEGALGLAAPSKVQPVYVGDVAQVFAQALTNPKSEKRTYDVVGPDVMTWPQLYHLASKYIGSPYPKPALAIPAWLAKAMVDAKLPGLPFNRSQVQMSLENSTADPAALCEDFNLELTAFEPSLAEYGSKM